MSKIAVVVLTDAETHADAGRFTNAMELAKEGIAHGDDVRIVFDGAGTRWVPLITDPNSKLHSVYQAVKGAVDGACHFCAGAFHVRKEIQDSEVPLLKDYEGHPSLRSYVAEGYQVLTF
jgi:hypothetical protein